MQTIISPAKDMATRDQVKDLYGLNDLEIDMCPSGEPLFWKEAASMAQEMAEFSPEDISRMLKCSLELAETAKEHYASFGLTFVQLSRTGNVLPASLAYNGVAYKHLLAGNLSLPQQLCSQGHLWIFSFLYGLLRPMDLILPYRMEGAVKLDVHQGKSNFDFWKPLLTDILIDSVRNDDGILLWCSTEEMKRMVDWKRLVREVEVIEPDFLVSKGSRLKSMAVYAKMCRGAMARMVSTESVKTEELKDFTHEGFIFNSSYISSDAHRVLQYVKTI